MRFLIVLALISFTTTLTGQRDKRTPFDKVIYKNGRPFIYENNEKAEIISIENIPIHQYLSIGATVDPTDWQKGFHRYIHYTWDILEMERKDSVQVVLSVEGKLTLKYYKLKEENRDKATQFHDSIITTFKVERQHKLIPASNFKHLTTRIDTKESAIEWISPKQALQDLDYLEWQLVNHYSYLDYKGFEYEESIDAIRQRLENGISKRDFARQLQMLVANFGDGHTRVSRSEIFLARRQLPFEITQKDGSFFGPQQILKIEGVPIEELYQLALDFVPKTTIGFQDYVATRLLNYIDFFLKEASKKIADQVEVEFIDGKYMFDLAPPSPRPRFDLLHDTIYDGNIGYLAIREYMSDEDAFLQDLDSIMKKLLATDALIIDIRGNGGGSRAPLLTILPYLIKQGTITNVARFRINEQEDHHPALGYLESRYLYPLSIDTSFWKDAEYNIDLENFKQSVIAFNKTFVPEMTPDLSKFSDMHYLYVEPNGTYYGKEIIVLMNERCFSASDIFAAGIRQGDKVKLMGKTSGGGSGFSKTKTLPNSGIGVRHSRMFSYQPNGKMYDGQGVQADIFSVNESEMIEEALEILKNRK